MRGSGTIVATITAVLVLLSWRFRFIERGVHPPVDLYAGLDRPGLVVLADAYYPGWIATVDGTPALVLPTNHLFRGVPAPAGTHRVRFEYRPASVILGAAASVVGWLVILLLAWRGWAARHTASAHADPVSPGLRG